MNRGKVNSRGPWNDSVRLYICGIVLSGLAFICGTASFLSKSALAQTLSDQVRDTLRDRITASSGEGQVACEGKQLCGSAVIPRFYWLRAFRPAWSTDGVTGSQATLLIKAIHEARQEGLNPEDYHLAHIQRLMTSIQDGKATTQATLPQELADLDLLLTDAFLLYAFHLSAGRVNPETIQAEWFIKTQEVDLAEVLQTALDKDQIAEALENLRPKHPGYERLKKALQTYQDIMELGGWPMVPAGARMERGDQGGRVKALRSRLAVSGDLDELEEGHEDVFDEALEDAVRRFQDRHGLTVDGIVGRATMAALNVPVGQRIRQIRLNLERWRWLPCDFERRYLVVNIANFELDVIEDARVIITMRVVTGTRVRRTPVFTGRMTYMELNPYWNIPPIIAKEDILPRLRKDPKYLVKENIRVFQGWAAEAPQIDPESVDWSHITPEKFPFKLRQDPGPSNALGRIKFMFPNKFDVYLHDTPARGLFNHTMRSFSSGCIRIEKPIELAEYLLRGQAEWTREKIVAAINSNKTQIVWIPEPIAVHILYWTAWVDQDAVIHLRDDIYGRDTPLDEALQKGPPNSSRI
jgi:murein L,D-transpeptidase YcbB/YkuD